MVRNIMKWRFLFLFAVLILNVFTKSLPVDKSTSVLVLSDVSLRKLEIPKLDGLEVISESETNTFKSDVPENRRPGNDAVFTEDASKASTNRTRNLTRNIRPEQTVLRYTVKISFGDDTFDGIVEIEVEMESDDDSIMLHVEGLDIDSVRIGLHWNNMEETSDINEEDGVLEITPRHVHRHQFVEIVYSGEISNFGTGIFRGSFDDYQYVAMNLFPTNARRVFPCMDELNAATPISFTFEDVPFDNIVSNSRKTDDDSNQFHALTGPPHLWGMVTHNLVNVVVPTTNVIIYGRSNLNQHNFAAIAINFFLDAFNDKLDKEYFSIDPNQDGTMHIFALPDTNVEWNALSTICIWEPYVFMTNTHSLMQRKTALVKIAEAMARQWFGYQVYPEDWKDQWLISGLVSHVAQDVVTELESSDDEDVFPLDMYTIFTTEVIQEALLLDSYSSSVVIFPEDDMFDEVDIRRHTLGLLKFKAPAIMRMLRLVLGDEDDYILRLGQILLNQRNAQSSSISTSDFFNLLNSESPDDDIVDDIWEFIEPWVRNTGYPVLRIAWVSSNTVALTQGRFSLTGIEPANYKILYTFTTNTQQDYNDVYPKNVLDGVDVLTLPNTLEEDDYVIFNIQGQGYFRVDYGEEHWNRIISALDDPDRRQDIHPLNRASLIDDALNLARAGELNYDIALRLALTWAHETEYAPWKAFIRNMEFLKKMLLSAVSDDDDLDSNIYTRMIQRTIETFEDEISFHPDVPVNEPSMTSLTRGIVMDHACRSDYDPCKAAAFDWFYDTNSNEPAVNPNIPVDIQPAVFCTMVREDGADATELLFAYLETGISLYDRLVVLESLACSLDEEFIDELITDTTSEEGRFSSEERSIVLAAILRSRVENVGRVFDFMESNLNEIRDMYGGPQKLEELLFYLGDNILNDDLANDFRTWIPSAELEESEEIANRVQSNVEVNMNWKRNYLDEVYTWIDENDAHTVVVSCTLLCFTALVSLFML